MTPIERFHGSLTSLVAAAMLAGCAGSPPTSPLAIEVSQSTSCVESIENQPAFAPLRAKSPALGDMSSTHLGDTAKPTPEEQALAKEYLAAVGERFKMADPDGDGTLDAKELNSKAGKALLALIK